MSKSENNNRNTSIKIEKKEEQNKINKESRVNIQNKKLDETKEEVTAISTLVFLKVNKDIEQNDLEYNLNLDKNIPKDTISTSTETESNNSQQENNSINSKLTFTGKIKQRAGSIWSSIKKINIKNMFPKAEYIEYKNANGDIVKIPKKKIPLKKKKKIKNDINNKISKEQNTNENTNAFTYKNAASGYYLIA